MGKTIAIMQPYFAPYLGYYRLLARADVFVLFDCVQFPRRGWVHRNRLANANGEATWLTLPLKPAPYEARIADLQFGDDAADAIAKRARACAMLSSHAEAAQFLNCAPFEGALVDYLERQIESACGLFDLTPELIRSSSLDIDPTLRGQARILAICERLGATAYINAPGGTDLYDAQAFAARGVELQFLTPYEGPNWSVLQRLAEETPAALARELRAA